MSKQCYYEVLGLARTASAEEVKGAYRKLAKEHHPDRNPEKNGADHKFKEINEAYEILKDPNRRAAYDRFGHAAFENGAGRGGPQGFDFSASFTDVFDDLFGEMMGGKRGRRHNRGGDLRYNMEITLEEAFRGKTSEIHVPTLVLCEGCGGSGAEVGSKPETCGTCAGHGKVRASQGFFTIERTCPKCRGAGRVVRNPCRDCSGSGHVQKERTLSVDIPAGVEDGNRIRLSGEGQAGMNGGPPGDLYIEIRLKKHDIFERDGDDLHCAVPISFTRAALGGEIEVPTLQGKAAIDIPEGTQAGKQFRLRGKGIKGVRSSYPGDLYCHIAVETPVKLTEHQRKLLKELDESLKKGGAKHSPTEESWADRLRGFFSA